VHASVNIPAPWHGPNHPVQDQGALTAEKVSARRPTTTTQLLRRSPSRCRFFFIFIFIFLFFFTGSAAKPDGNSKSVDAWCQRSPMPDGPRKGYRRSRPVAGSIIMHTWREPVSMQEVWSARRCGLRMHLPVRLAWRTGSCELCSLGQKSLVWIGPVPAGAGGWDMHACMSQPWIDCPELEAACYVTPRSMIVQWPGA
jgi:hypothetical protein